MKKLPFLLATLSIGIANSQEIQLIHDTPKNEKENSIFEPYSPYRVLQDALFKKQIYLRSLEKKSSKIFAAEKAKNSWQTKVQELLTGKKELISFSNNPKDLLVFWDIPSDLSLQTISRVHSDRLILFTFNPEVPNSKEFSPKAKDLFSKIYTWNDDLVDDKKFFKFHIPALKEFSNDAPSFSDRMQCVLINTQTKFTQSLVSEKRSNLMHTMQSQWTNGVDETNFEDQDTLKNYRFSICYEDVCNTQGYISDKIFASFSNGCVPIYLGASNITQYIPTNCFIDRRDFDTDNELCLFLSNLTEDDYNLYISNIKAFLKTKEAKMFSMEEFTKVFTKAVEN